MINKHFTSNGFDVELEYYGDEFLHVTIEHENFLCLYNENVTESFMSVLVYAGYDDRRYEVIELYNGETPLNWRVRIAENLGKFIGTSFHSFTSVMDWRESVKTCENCIAMLLGIWHA